MPQLPTAWEQITLGMVSYSRPAVEVFAQAQVRQAAVLCIDRQAITRLVFAMGATAMDLPPEKDPELIEEISTMIRMIIVGARTPAAFRRG